MERSRQDSARGGAIDLAAVEDTLRRLYLGGGDLRVEDRKKAREVAALLLELRRVGRRDLVVEAAAGHAYVGLVAAELLGLGRLVLIEREQGRADRSVEAHGRLLRSVALEARVGDVGDAALWPDAPDVALALHACGAAADRVIAGATSARARWILVVPCCYENSLPAAGRAASRADALGLPRQAEVRRKFIESHVDAERTLRLEAAGYEVWAVAFVGKEVTPHNLLLKARRVGEPKRMAEAAAQLERLLGPIEGAR